MDMSDVKPRIKSSYDAIAPTYNAWAARDVALRIRFLDQLLDLLPAPSQTNPPPLKAVELGCGGGVPITQALLSSPRGHTFHVTANDLSSTQIALGKQALGDGPARIRWVEGDMISLAFPDGSLDVVVALYSVIHLPHAEQDKLLRRITRWLKPATGLALVNFTAEKAERTVMPDWLGGWIFWSGWGADATLRKVGDELEVVASEVTKTDGVDASFLWVIARPLGKSVAD